MSVTVIFTVDIHGFVAKESILNTMYVVTAASVSLATMTMTVLPEKLVVILMANVNQEIAM